MNETVRSYVERSYGSEPAAIFALAADLMRGNPRELRAGYSAANALLSAVELIASRPETRAELAEAFAFALGERR